MKTRSFLRWLGALTASLLLAVPASLQAQPPSRVDVLIGFVSPPTPEDVAILRAVGGQVRHVYSIVPAVAVSVPEPALRGLARDHRVRYIEADGPVYATAQEVPWGIHRLFNDSEPNRTATWTSTAKGAGIKVAVLDTGIANHEDLAVAGGVSFVGGGYSDGHGHGTHVAGTIAALDNTVGVVGAAPGAALYAVKVLSDSGSGTISGVVAGIDWSVANGMDVVNMSLSGGHHQTLKDAADNAYAAGVLLVASAGNSGNSAGTGNNVGYPAAYDSVIAVAASDINNKRASFSSTGPQVELTAPGVAIKSTVPGGYATWNGTSMASPHVAGTAALVLAANPSLTAGEVRKILQDTARDLGPAGRDSHYGFGLVRAKEAVDAAGSPPEPPPANQPPTANFTYSVDGLTVTFTDVSSDSDGSVMGWAWNFGDGTTSNAQNPTRTYAAAGTYTVTLTVTDNEGATGTVSQSVTVASNSSPDGIVLSAVGYKIRGRQHADLKWSGATSTSVDIYRNAVKIATVANNGSYTDNIGQVGGGSYTYQVCEAGTSNCSNTATVTF